jgi:hypothetical protein
MTASTISAVVVVVGIVDVAPYMRRIMTAAVVVGIIIVDIAWTDRQVNPYAAAGTFDLNYMTPDALAGLQIGSSPRFGIGHWRNAKNTDRQRACHQIGCE